MFVAVFMLFLIVSGEAIKINDNLRRKVHHTKQGSVEQTDDGAETIDVYTYTDENGETIYENYEQHEASCKRRVPILCDHKHHGLLSAKLVGLYTRYYEQVKVKNKHIISYKLTELLAGTNIDDMLGPLDAAKEDLVSLGNKCGGIDHFHLVNGQPQKQRCNFCGERGGCDGLRKTEEWFDAALRKVIFATNKMTRYITGFEASADAWIKTLEETRDTSFDVCKACAVAIAVPMATGMVGSVGTKLIVGAGVGGITSGTVTAGTEGLKQGLDMYHGLQKDFDWNDFANAVGESMRSGAVGGAAGVIMNLGTDKVLASIIDKLASRCFKKLVENGVVHVAKSQIAEYLAQHFKAAIRQLLISCYKLSTDPEYSSKDMFDDMAFALLVGGVAHMFGMDPKKVNNIAVTDKLVKVVRAQVD